jgi:hypothetical protein
MTHLGAVDTELPVAQVESDNGLRLRNRSDTPWRAFNPVAGQEVDVLPGATVVVAAGTRVDFGKTVGVVKC